MVPENFKIQTVYFLALILIILFGTFTHSDVPRTAIRRRVWSNQPCWIWVKLWSVNTIASSDVIRTVNIQYILRIPLYLPMPLYTNLPTHAIVYQFTDLCHCIPLTYLVHCIPLTYLVHCIPFNIPLLLYTI